MKCHFMIAFLAFAMVEPQLAVAQQMKLSDLTANEAASVLTGRPLYTNSPRITVPGGVPSVFGYPGNKCPVGSEPYKGPETQTALESGSIYCVFKRRVIARPKSIANGKCPDKVYVDPKYKPDADTVWCETTAETQ